MKTKGLDLAKVIEGYKLSCRAEGKSPRTVEWYFSFLARFTRFLAGSGMPTDVAGIGKQQVRAFILHLQSEARVPRSGAALSPATVQGYARTIKAFFSWAVREGYTTDNLLANIKLPKAPVKIVQPLTPDEIEKLISAQNPLTAMGCRDIAILVTLLDTGIRLSELANLLFEDTHIEEGYLELTGKGSRERLVPIGAVVQKMLWRYIFHFRPEPATAMDNYLFLTLDGKHMLPNAVRLLLHRWGRRAGVPRLHAHLCRHTYATNFLTHKCGDVFRLKLILGHSTLEMVNRYVHFASAQDMLKGRVASPLDQLGIKRLRGYKIDKTLKNGNNHAGPS